MTAATAVAAPARAGTVELSRRVRATHLFVLSGLAVAQPLFEVLGRAPEFFAVRGSTAAEIVALALAVLLAPPAALFSLGLLAEAGGPRAVRVIHLTAVATLAGLLALQALKRLDANGELLLLAAEGVGLAAALAYMHAAAARLFLTVMLPAPLVFATVFLHRSPAWELALEGPPPPPAALEAKRTPPIVMVVFDEFPVTSLLDENGRIDAVRYPNFARFARDATWFRNATTVHEFTTHAVPSILTGHLPRRGRLPVYADHPRNLFTLLPPAYRFNVRELITRLCPPERCRPDSRGAAFRSLVSDASVAFVHTALPDGLVNTLPSITERWLDFRLRPEAQKREIHTATQKTVVDAFNQDPDVAWERFLARIDPTLRPTLHFIHTAYVHGPWGRFPSGERYEHSQLDYEVGSADLTASAYQRHLLNVGYADTLVRDLVTRLKQARLYDRSLVIFVADHGASFRAHEDRRSATRASLSEIAYVPLFVKTPEQSRGRIVERHVRTTDVVPMIASVLGAEGSHAGRSPFTPHRPATNVAVARDNGDVTTAPVAVLVREHERALARKVALFGSGDPARLYARAATRELIGARLDDAPASAGVTLELDERLAVASENGPLPALVSGRLRGPRARAGLDLAVAVNGRVVATTRSFEVDNRVRFATLVPDDSLRPGPNSVTVYTALRGRQPQFVGSNRRAARR